MPETRPRAVIDAELAELQRQRVDQARFNDPELAAAIDRLHAELARDHGIERLLR
jgi:hypothetical protein